MTWLEVARHHLLWRIVLRKPAPALLLLCTNTTYLPPVSSWHFAFDHPCHNTFDWPGSLLKLLQPGQARQLLNRWTNLHHIRFHWFPNYSLQFRPIVSSFSHWCTTWDPASRFCVGAVKSYSLVSSAFSLEKPLHRHRCVGIEESWVWEASVYSRSTTISTSIRHTDFYIFYFRKLVKEVN